MLPRATLNITVFLFIILLHAPLLFGQRRANPPFEPDAPSVFSAADNLALHADTEASPHWSDRVPQFAVDGKHDSANEHFAAENIPVFLTVDLNKPRQINAVHLWTYWDGRRYYQYIIEASPDGREWQTVADNRDNTIPATSSGRIYVFPRTTARYVRVTFTYNSAGNKAGGHIVELQVFNIDEKAARREKQRQEQWHQITPGLHGAVTSVDKRHGRDSVPRVEENNLKWEGTGWRGERVSGQFILWSSEGEQQVRLETDELRSAEGEIIPGSAVRASFVRYVLADRVLVPDVIDPIMRLDIPAKSVRPVWLSINIPRDVSAGDYTGRLTVRAEGGKSLSFSLKLRVQSPELPDPEKWAFHLDLWQNPYTVARYHHVRLWSAEHFALLKPHLEMLAAAGQKCLTTTIIYRPWGTQTYDPYDSMVEWILEKGGKWRFDYTVFDRYVEFGMSCGINKSINCYSMVPWTNRVRYLDEKNGDYKYINFRAGDETFIKLWTAFLADFREHLRKKGWLDITAIAMDERPLKMMRPTIDLLHRVAPELRIALAGSDEPRLAQDIDDWCIYITPPVDSKLINRRNTQRNDRDTTFYVCCFPARPNTFTFSPPAEAEWIGLYASARGFTGFLRWAYDSWTEDPLYDTKHVTWPAGDCFLVYPGCRSSIRFERLREGIEDYEKIRLLRQWAATDYPGEISQLDSVLSEFTYENVNMYPAEEVVNRARAVIDKLSESITTNRH
ncbi:MAG TPA: DUF4091 domain-containing protein [Phycisphaeraceae bacterium]|nr:DUF4091 domain-containing protein [Phycisphaeraceae bacterium]